MSFKKKKNSSYINFERHQLMLKNLCKLLGSVNPAEDKPIDNDQNAF